MTYSSWSKNAAVRSAEQRNYPQGVINLIQSICQSIDEGGILHTKVLARPNVIFNVKWAMYVIDTYNANEQPSAINVQRAIQAAHQTCLNSAFANNKIVQKWISCLANGGQINVRARGKKDFSACHIDSFQSDVEQFVADLIDMTVFAASSCSGFMLKSISSELALNVIMQGETPESYTNKLDKKLRTTKNLESIIYDTILPESDEYLVLFNLLDLNIKNISSYVLQHHNIEILDLRHRTPYKLWGLAGTAVQAFVEDCRPSIHHHSAKSLKNNSPSTFLTLRVHGTSSVAAVHQARVELYRFLSVLYVQYPSATPTIYPFQIVAKLGSKTVNIMKNGFAVSGLDIEEVKWPNNLYPSLMSANAMRHAGGTSSQAALAWASLEAAGLEPTDVSLQKLARMMSLHTLRQRIVFSYRDLVSHAKSSNEISRAYKYLAIKNRKSYLNFSREALTKPSSVARSNAIKKYRICEVLYLRLNQLQKAHENKLSNAIENLKVCHQSPRGELNLTRLAQYKRWCNILEDGVSSDYVNFPDMNFILSCAPIPLNHEISEIQSLISDPASLQKYLDIQTNNYVFQLRNLYTARNLNFHSGNYELMGATLLANFGMAVVDGFFEILSTWYKDSRISANISVNDILNKIEQRYLELTSGRTIISNEIGGLTGP
ncbi:hypothetical protein [Kocuria sp. U4B]